MQSIWQTGNNVTFVGMQYLETAVCMNDLKDSQNTNTILWQYDTVSSRFIITKYTFRLPGM